MARSTYNQAMTRDPNKLVIGVMRVRIGDTKNVSNATDAGLNETNDLGALRSASLSITPTTKEHQSGYPKQTDLVIDEAVQGTLTVEMEELAGPKCLEFIDSIINSINTGVTSYHCAEALALFATGSRLSFFSNYCYLKPELSLSFGNDFNVAPFTFELLYNPKYTNNKLLYRQFVEDFSGRDTQYQPITKDAANLQIGFCQVRIGRMTPRPAWTATVDSVDSTTLTGGTTVPAEKVVVVSNETMSVACADNSGYTAPYRGTYRVWYDGTNINVMNPEMVEEELEGGTPTPNTYTPAATVTLTDGSNLVLSFSDYLNLGNGDKWEFEVDPVAWRGRTKQVAGNAYSGTATASGDYTGAVDGAFIIEATGTNAFTFTAPDGTTGSVTGMLVDTDYALQDGVSIKFSAVLTTGQKWIIPVYSGQAQSGTKTSILSPYSILTHHDSIGSVQNTTLNISSTMKEHTSGAPAKKDLAVLESSNVTVEVTMEELAVDSGQLVAENAKTVFDAMLDGAVNQTKYFAPVELTAELATGGTPLRFWLPCCQIVPNIEVSPGDDWAGVPFQLKAVRQTGLANAPSMIVRN